MNTTHEDSIADLLKLAAQYLGITKALAAFDLETTGVNVEQDRIVEITVGRVEPVTFRTQVFRALVNPGRPIPPDATAVHAIGDADVANEPRFEALAPHVVAMLSGADLVGFNHRRFDVRMIAAECQRVGRPDPCAGARLVDVYRVFTQREPRDLSGAMRFYCGEDLTDAHGTNADVLATLRVMLAQFERYDDLPRDLDALHALNRDPTWVDQDGKIQWKNGEACLSFGKHAGVPLRHAERSYLDWVARQEWCPADTREILKQAVRGKYPVPAATAAA